MSERIILKIKMELLSDAIFGNGMSVPGAEDISVLCDEQGFPYYKGTTFKGVFREELTNYLRWTGKTDTDIQRELHRLLGSSGDDVGDDRLIFSDFTLSEKVRQTICQEIEKTEQISVTDILTNLRTFTKITDDGAAEKGSLRIARCVDQGLVFYSEIICSDNAKNKDSQTDVEIVKNVLGLIKWIGSLRNRGFGKVRVRVEEEKA